MVRENGVLVREVREMSVKMILHDLYELWTSTERIELKFSLKIDSRSTGVLQISCNIA